MMKFILVALLVLVFAMPVMAGKWDPSRDQLVDLLGDIQIEKDREKIYSNIKLLISQGMNADVVVERSSFLSAIAKTQFHRWEDDEDQRPIPFTDWDKKLLKLLVDNGANLNRVYATSGGQQYSMLLLALDNRNFDLAKEMVALGANYQVGFLSGFFKEEENVLTHTIGEENENDIEAFEYFFKLGHWVPNTIPFCSAGIAVGESIGRLPSEYRFDARKILKILETAGYDWENCRVVIGATQK